MEYTNTWNVILIMIRLYCSSLIGYYMDLCFFSVILCLFLWISDKLVNTCSLVPHSRSGDRMSSLLCFLTPEILSFASGSASEPILCKSVSLQNQLGFFLAHLHCVQMLPVFVGPQFPAAWQYKCTLIHEFLSALARGSVSCGWSCVAYLLQVFGVVPP